MFAYAGTDGANQKLIPLIQSALTAAGFSTELFTAYYFPEHATPGNVPPPQRGEHGIVDPNLGADVSPVPYTNGVPDYSQPGNILVAYQNGDGVLKWVDANSLAGAVSDDGLTVNVSDVIGMLA